MTRCFHCNEPVHSGTSFSLTVAGKSRCFCCPGCRAVADLIETEGLSRYYDFRNAPAQKPEASLAGQRDPDDAWTVCDRPEVARRLAEPVAAGLSELRFGVGGVTCAACGWLLDQGLCGLEGVEEASVNPVSCEALVRFDPHRVRLSEIMRTTASFGFEPRLALGGSSEGERSTAERAELKRLAVAGLGFAQVMTLSAALYLGAFKSMDQRFTSFFVLASMLVATPVVLYAGAPIFRSAGIGLARRHLNMDVPVCLAIAMALAASLINAFRGSAVVYFDSATMFVFFLTLGRYLESRARTRAGGLLTALASSKPLSANRLESGAIERVGTIELEPGDRVVVGPGETVPADGELVSPAGCFDESVLSGESIGRDRLEGDSVLGGSLNLSSGPVEVRVTRIGADGYVERIANLLHRSMTERPAYVETADRWAGWFVGAVLLLTAAVGAFWLVRAPENALEVVLAMLVVTCPCALSLAAPTAFAVALGRLARFGLLCRSARALERIGQVDLWLFDKTGTLTRGHVTTTRFETFNSMDEPSARRLAAALEAGVEHPIARALTQDDPVMAADAVRYEPGFGVTGCIAGKRYGIGSARFAGVDAGLSDEGSNVYLFETGRHPIARITLADTLRPHAIEAIACIERDGARAMLVSGDSRGAVGAVARELGIGDYAFEQTPQDKLEIVTQRQRAGDVVAAVGDGVNDAPLLARADVSVAMVEGSQLAQASADVIFTGADLRVLAQLPRWARKTSRVVRENLTWAVIYNSTAIPLAASGMLAPWMAALGMSLSSLIVVANALRLGGTLTMRPEDDPAELSALPRLAVGQAR